MAQTNLAPVVVPDSQSLRHSALRTFGPSDHRTTGPSDHRTFAVRPAHRALSLPKGGPSSVPSPDKYAVLTLRRRRAQIAARHALERAPEVPA